MKVILTDAAAIGNAAARAISFFPREPGNLIYGKDSAWMMAFTDKDVFFEVDGARNLDARTMFHYPYTAVTPAMAAMTAMTLDHLSGGGTFRGTGGTTRRAGDRAREMLRRRCRRRAPVAGSRCRARTNRRIHRFRQARPRGRCF